MEIFSQEHFELIVRKSLPPGVPDSLVTSSARDMRCYLLQGFDAGLAGEPLPPFKKDRKASRNGQRYAKSLYDMYAIGYRLGKGVI